MRAIKSNRSWFALYTKPRQEFKAALEMSARNIEYYLPTVTRLKKWSDRKKKVTEPLMRSYLFINATENERLDALESETIVRCISERGKPFPIPEQQIVNLKNFIQEKIEYLVMEGIAVGKKVRIMEGPFAGVEGTIMEIENQKSLAVSIEILNRTAVAHIPDDIKVEVIAGTNCS